MSLDDGIRRARDELVELLEARSDEGHYLGRCDLRGQCRTCGWCRFREQGEPLANPDIVSFTAFLAGRYELA